ncbi:MAG: ABC transporter permease [Myxococcota bacterium]
MDSGTFAGVAFATQALRITVPYALAALGGTLSERSGVVALALEGMLLGGAFAATLAAHADGTAVAGVFGGIGGGLAIAAVYGLVVLYFGADQVVASVATNLLALGLTPFLLELVFGSSASSPPIPGLGPDVLLEPLFWLTVALVILTTLLITKTPFGLRLRAVGDHPDAAESLGIRVMPIRWIAVLGCGALAGLGGAWLALSAGGFTDEMSGGRGYIALAAVIMGKWRPAAAALACLFFGCAEALQVTLQTTAGGGIPRELVQMLPYVLTIVVIAGFIGRSRPPAALGRPR